LEIAFLSPSLSRAAGGIFEIERCLAQGLSQIPDTSVRVYGLEDAFTEQDLKAWAPLVPRAHPVRGIKSFGYSSALRRDFLATDADIAHLHALWTYTSPLVYAWSRRTDAPYLITLNGMLDRWALKNSWLKKRVAALLYENRCLKGAACIHVNTESELASARSFGLKGPFCVIPNGVAIPVSGPSSDDAIEHEVGRLKGDGKHVLLYLGRLHPKKGLISLLDGIARLKNDYPDWVLVIAGWDQLGHKQELQRRVNELKLERRVRIIGAQYGEDKSICLHFADASILPSLSEGLPMSVLEAWAHAKPVVMTPACNLDVGYAARAAIRVLPEPGSLEAGLRELFEMSPSEREGMGKRGKALVETELSWSIVSQQMRDVYAWLLSGGPRPRSVVQ
jgi:glycosyltransferase involved in cell wall biosynthesis